MCGRNHHLYYLIVATWKFGNHAECDALFILMLNVIMHCAVLRNVIVLNVVILSAMHLPT
jgi:hypothetical protein